MSRYDWERGEIVIPKSEWARFKKNLREAYNRGLAQDLVRVQRAVGKMRAVHKGKRNVDWNEALIQALTGAASADHSPRAQQLRDQCTWLITDWYAISQAVLQCTKEASSDAPAKYRPRALKKKDFPMATSKTLRFAAGDDRGAILLDEVRHTVCWSVPENNRACQTARESYMGRTFFQILDRIAWKRNSGGRILGNDEYNQDAGRDHEGGGGSYLKNAYGPLGSDERPRVRSPRRKVSAAPSEMSVTLTPGMLQVTRRRY
ncbi:MAG: hypothetical protein RB191_02265 [Terriglobia bacterium]|nr:hypothetical protein [Terriglobia bacterium]